MEKDSGTVFRELKEDVSAYVELKLELLKLSTYERTGKVIAVLSYGLILLFLAFFAILFIFLVANFNKISVRESGLIERLSPLTQKTIYNVVDPTLLLTASDYDLIATKPKVKNKYVLFYAVGPTEEALKLAHRIAKERQCQLIDITNKQISPNEFLGYFKYATFAVVVSFHGTVFSLMYKTNFYTYATGTTSDIRYYNLLDGLNMGDRCIKAMPQTIEDVDFSKLDKKMQQFTAFSKDYINDVIQQSPSDK